MGHAADESGGGPVESADERFRLVAQATNDAVWDWDLDVVVGEDHAARSPGVRPGRHLRIAVEDTGPGIAADVLERVFEPFFTTKEAGRGSGLGLAMVEAITRNHGGLVHVESAPGRGTRFVVTLPASSAR